MTTEPSLDCVAVALDTPERQIFDRWCTDFGPRVGVLKVGLEAFVRWGAPAVAAACRHGRSVFLDLKLHDIPNTVAGAVRSAKELGVDYLTVHAGGGRATLEAAAEAAAGELNILAVTVLTHLDAAALSELDLPGGSAHRVERWAGLARAAGCDGVVCSAREVAVLRQRLPRPFTLVTPGIRWGGASADDQKRVADPAGALAAGSDLLVIGRPLTAAPDPEAALASLRREISAVR